MNDVIYQYDSSLDGFLCCVYESYVYKEAPAAFCCDEDPLSLYEVRTVVTQPAYSQRVSRGIAARQLAGSQHQHGAHTLAAAQQAVTRCLADLSFYRQINIAQFVQALFRLLHKGFILLLITFLFHGEKPPYPAGSLIRAGLCQRCVDLFDL